MKKRDFILCYGILIPIWFAFCFYMHTAIYMELYFFIPIMVLIDNHYLFPRSEWTKTRSLTQTAKGAWVQCVFAQAIATVCSLANYFICDGESKEDILPFMSLFILTFIFTNVVSKYSCNRAKIRNIFIVIGVVQLFALLYLFNLYNGETDPSRVAGIIGYSVMGVIILSWLISLPISYNKHVKIMQYSGKEA